MNETGIIKRVDDLGRIDLPKELRRNLMICEGTPMEIHYSKEGIFIKKYYPESELSEMIENLMEALEDMCVDLGQEKIEDIRRHILEIQEILKDQIEI